MEPYNEAVDTIRVPDNIELFGCISYSYIPACKSCQHKFFKKVDVLTFIIVRIQITKHKVLNKLKIFYYKHFKKMESLK